MSTPPSRRRARAVAALGARVGLGLDRVLGVAPRVDGLDRLSPGGAIIAFNHLSPIDPFLLAWLLTDAGHHEPVVLLRQDIPRIPVLGRLLDAGAIQLHDDSPATPDEDPSSDADEAAEGASGAFRQACEYLAAGHSVLVAPERGTSPSLELMPLRSGPAGLAAATGAPLVPVGLFGTQRLFDGDRFVGRRNVPVAVTFGYPVMTGPSPRATTKMLRLDLEALYERALDDYPDRDQGEAGADWWPARRGGSAPSFGAVVEARAAGEAAGADHGTDDLVSAEVWAADLTAALATADHRDAVVEELDDDGLPVVSLSHDEIAELYPRSYHRNAAQQGGHLRDLRAVLAFDLPGQPYEHHGGVNLDHHLDGLLLVHTSTGRLVLADVDLSATPTRVVVYGRMELPHTLSHGGPDGTALTVPAGTLVTLLGVPESDPAPAPITDWKHVHGLYGRA